VHLIVDGMNVIGARPDGWWRDRAGAQARLVAAVDRLGGDRSEVTVVFDGRPPRHRPSGGSESDDHPSGGTVRVLFAPGGPNAADDAIVALVGGLDRPGDVVVVTSDRNLAQQVRRLGATVEGAGKFWSRLETQ
jgi:predicted RNA-binding protein with PIN domain